jgi:hypothetical protein
MADERTRVCDSPQKFPIFTFVTDDQYYSEMRSSFEQAGFTGDRASFFELRSLGRPGEPDPYSTISRLIAERPEPFFILCHQDVRLDQGDGFDALAAALADLDARDPLWAVAGNAGGGRRLRNIRCITDPHGRSNYPSLPAAVHSLDENFLVIRTGTGIRCSRSLGGFHLYASDLCLNALQEGLRAYVIQFHLHHLSGGRRDASYYASSERFVNSWSTKVVARYLRVPMEVLFLSRWPPLRRIFGHPKIRSILKNHASAGALAGLLLAPRTKAPTRGG